MSIQLSSIERAPRHAPPWRLMLENLCQLPPARVARVLGLSVRSVQRYNAAGDAPPRVVCLALFWMT